MPPPPPLCYLLPEAGSIPNHPFLPLVVLPRAVPPGDDPAALAAAIEQRYRQHGWSAAWRYGVYPFPHYHTTAHEVLGCFRGRATLRFGGEPGPVLELTPGDVVVIPAGVGHQNLGSSDDFQVCGGYPAGQDADLIRADDAAPPADVRERIARVPTPDTDPLFGPTGPLMAVWHQAGDPGHITG